LSDAEARSGALGPGQGGTIELPRDFAWVTGLGSLKSVSHASVAAAAIAALGLAFAAIAVSFLLGAILQAVTHFPDSAQTIVFGSIWTVALAGVGYYLGMRAGRMVAVYEGGLAMKDHARVRAWSWGDIAAVSIERKRKGLEVPHETQALGMWLAVIGATWLILRLRGKRPSTHTVETTLTIYDTSGGTCVIDIWFRAVDPLADLVEDEVARRVGPTLRAQFEGGDRLDFGALSISRAGGIQIGTRTIPWEAVEQLGIAEEKLAIEERGSAAAHTIAVSHLKNARVCVELLRAGIEASSTGAWP
jgi:hypothetical protein